MLRWIKKLQLCRREYLVTESIIVFTELNVLKRKVL